MSGPCVAPGFEARGGLQIFHGLREFRGEGVVDSVLDVEAIGADAGLAGVAIFRSGRAFDGGVDVGIVENDEGSVAAELERDFLDGAGALRHEQLADFGRAGERKFADDRIGCEFAADFDGRAGDYVEDAFRNAGAFAENSERERGKRRLLRGLDDERAAGSERGTGFARDHGEREIPWSDRGDDADGLLDHDDALVGLMLRDRVAVNALPFFGEPLDERGGVGDFAF